MSALKFVPPRVQLCDPRTGFISREWYLFLQGIFERVGGSNGQSTSDIAAGMFRAPDLRPMVPAVDSTEAVLAMSIFRHSEPVARIPAVDSMDLILSGASFQPRRPTPPAEPPSALQNILANQIFGG